jgi:hypothetical protein
MSGTKGNPNASFFVQLRNFERQLMREALLYCDDDEAAAAKLLGIEPYYFRSRGRKIGGVFENDPPKEPYQWESNPSMKKGKPDKPDKPSKPKKKPREKPQDELPAAGAVADDPGESADDTDGSAGGADLEQGGLAGDNDQPGNGEHLQPDG